MDQESQKQMVLHLWQVEKLSIRQIAKELRMCRKRIKVIITGTKDAPAIAKKTVLDEYAHLIGHWYKQHPKLKAEQIYQRLLDYGYKGSYSTVVRYSKEYRKPKQEAYYPLKFVPGEEAQVDWFFFNDEYLGMVSGFVYVLSYSRYAWGMFYPKNSFEFFLAGHLACFEHLNGLAHSHRYDNLRSVVIKRSPQIQYNGQFLDFARFFGFSIHVCNPYAGHEKGRVERLIRDIRVFLYGKTFKDLADLNYQFHQWLFKRNETIHRVTDKTPKELLAQERLLALPQGIYPIARIAQAVASKTALVEFETNKYSLPSTCAGHKVEVVAGVERIEIFLNRQKVATHKRCFGRKQTMENPLHAQKLLDYSSAFKFKRILQLICGMDDLFDVFIEHQDDETQQQAAAYQIFMLLKTHSKAMLISAVRELNGMRCFKISGLLSLLNIPQAKAAQPLWPQNKNLLNLNYEERKLNDYDPDTKDLGGT